jgi:hypothetical protein
MPAPQRTQQPHGRISAVTERFVVIGAGAALASRMTAFLSRR